MSGTFLSRWSRRKQEARRAEAPLGAEAEAQRSAPQAPEPEARGEPVAGPEEPALTAEEIAELPKLEDLTPDSDLSAFLRKGVPEGLRNAALRRMWSLDPAIRDFVGEARDYAYDWNTPGGVPGTGELLPGQDVGAMLRQVFGEAEPEPEARAGPSPVAPSRDRDTQEGLQEKPVPDRPTVAAQPDRADETGASPASSGLVQGDRGPRAVAAGPPPRSLPAAAQQELTSGPGKAPARSRHGGAEPL